MSFKSLIRDLLIDGRTYEYYDLQSLNDPRYDELPICIRYLLESVIRHCDGFHVLEADVEKLLDWKESQKNSVEIPFVPARVLLQDFTGVPAIVDLAAMRDAVHDLGSHPSIINPICPVDLVVDHSVQVDYYGISNALLKNQAKEFERNKERFAFLKWGAESFKNLRIVPPGSGIVHQVNLEYLSRGVFVNDDGVLYPDSVVGTDSHTTMNNGSGVLSWGVGGIEAEAVMLGQPISLVIPEVIGFCLEGELSEDVTSTDLVLVITKTLRDFGVVGKFVEFFGSGLKNLSIADRATISNMCPEYGATVAFFPVDDATTKYLRQTGRDQHEVNRIKCLLKRLNLFVDHNVSHINYTKVLNLDLGNVVPCLSGPKRPQDCVFLNLLHSEFKENLTSRPSFKGFGIKHEDADLEVCVKVNGHETYLKHGSVVISAITSCTNTSNPSVMLAAGLVAKRAVEAGLKVPPYVKTSLAPGSGVVTKYLEKSGLLPYLEKLGYFVVGYGCTTCIGNSGPLDPNITEAIEKNNLIAVSVLSGNRNFEGRVHPNTRANYLASPPLVVIYGIAGRIDIDLKNEPLGIGKNGQPVYFDDIWPSRHEIIDLEETCVLPHFFNEVYERILNGSEEWRSLNISGGSLYDWDPESTYIKKVPFLDAIKVSGSMNKSIHDAYVLLSLGDSVTTDHISPAGSISRSSPAAKYLMSRGVEIKDFNSYGARRGNDEVMARGTFANIRLFNKLIGRVAPKTVHIPTGKVLDVFDAAEQYKYDGLNVIIFAGKEYGCGSSRDWAAKGPFMLGVKAVIAESFERIHRSNLIGMGILPLQFLSGENFESLNLRGDLRYSIEIMDSLAPGEILTVEVSDKRSFNVKCRIDTAIEMDYYMHGGILLYMVEKMIKHS